jgi:sulfur-oxidizing protein SoxZ
MRIKAKLKKGKITVKGLAKHPMTTYDEAKKKGTNANYIIHMIGKVNDKTVYEMTGSQFLSKNPYVKFAFTGAKKGDPIEITWTDLSGKSKTSKSKIK